ncbi:MAG: hypothetical protein ACYCZY_06170 [Lacisediminihabitans sp.]
MIRLIHQRQVDFREVGNVDIENTAVTHLTLDPLRYGQTRPDQPGPVERFR